MLNIRSLLTDLADSRKVFHSEADFQHALAWHIHQKMPEIQIRLEFPAKMKEQRKMYVDIYLPDEKIAIELKYVTRSLKLEHNDEAFALSNHSAHPQRRYDFLDDIHRLERMRNKPGLCKAGYAVLLTNDPSYWNPPPPRERGTVDADFRIHEGKVISGKRAWACRVSSGTMKGREGPLQLAGCYHLRWQDFSDITEKSWGNRKQRGKFRYLAVSVC